MKKTILFTVLALLCLNFRVNGQNSTPIKSGELKGKVIDEQGLPLPGATIKIQNSANAAITNQNGEFHVKNGFDKGTLSVTFVGFQSVTVPFATATNSSIIITLKSDASSLNEVQVIGYGTTTKRLNTGSVSTISASDIEKQPVTNVLSGMSGRVPGVFIQTTNGLPGGNINIQIRGKGSLTAGTAPLFIIDGVPFDSGSIENSSLSGSPVNGIISPLNSLNPSDIESMSILKDADATSIYGSRGANGVILITTKQGKAGADRISATYTQGFNSSTNLPKFLSLSDYLAIRREAFANDKVTPTTGNAADLLVWNQNQSTDWGKYFFGNTAHYTDVQAGVSGGSVGTTYNLSANFHQEDNVITDLANYIRGGLHFGLKHISANKRFELQFTNAVEIDNNTSPNIQNSANGLYLAPNFPLYDPSGAYTLNSGNPIRDMNATANANSNNLISSLNLSYAITDNLKLKVNGGYNRIENDQTQLFPLKSLQSGTNYAQYGQNSNQSYIVEPQFTFDKKFKNSLLSVLIGGTYQDRTSESQFIKASNFSNEGLMENISSAASIDTRINTQIDYKYISAFGRVTYNLLDKYVFNATIRRDGSSRFGPDNRFGNFGSLGAAWIFSEENWLKNKVPAFSYGKLRISYGTTGNDQITDYQYLSTYSSPGYTYQGIAVLRPSRIDNSDFHWETTRKLEFGLETGFLNNRILLNVDYYYNRSSSQLVNYSLPFITGFGSYQANLPAVIQNTGLELDLTTANIKHKDFSWTTTFNLTIPENKLVSFQNFATSSYAQNYQLGYDITRIKGYHFLGVDPQTGTGLYADQNGVASTTPYANYTIGKSSPDLYGGFGNTLIYKRFTVDVFFQFVKQMAFGGVRNSLGLALNNYAFMADRWQSPGDITNIPKPSTISSPYYITSSANYFNASYLRLKNLSVNYSLPESLIHKIKAAKANIFLRGENILTFWNKNTGLIDPESGGYLAGQTNVPPVKSIVAGLQFTF